MVRISSAHRSVGMGINMNTDVNEIIDNAIGQVRTILVDAVEKVNDDARAQLIEKFNKVVGGSEIVSVKASRVAVKVKSAKKTAQAKDKPKRVVSEATRKKLAVNLKKARAAKATRTPGKVKSEEKAKKK